MPSLCTVAFGEILQGASGIRAHDYFAAVGYTSAVFF
jgi:hypothetical protein